ncbi:MAG: hypothetical protein JWL86_3185, partial [Rhizobium sp.]|nr:hypothetical protein [Rhizobium sp.]
AITVLGERNDGGANARALKECAGRWSAAGREVLSIMPRSGDDFADAWRGVAA